MRATLPRTAALVALLLFPAAGASGQSGLPARASVTPGIAKIGERVIYRGQIFVSPRSTFPFLPRFLPPEKDSLLTWGTPHVLKLRSRPPAQRGGAGEPDTFVVEVPVQAFAPGRYTLPGLRFYDSARQGNDVSGQPPHDVMRFPQVELIVVSTLTAADSTANLRDVHGPLKAPWWERVPWLWIAAALVLIAALVWVVRRLRRRTPKVVAPVAPAPAPRRDPVLEALNALAALRREALPEAGRFAEHAFELGRILRRFLEATTGLTRPGDTTPELIGALRVSDLGPDDIQRLAALLRGWDLVKFAREPVDAASAHRHEDSVEAFVRSVAAGRSPGATGKAVA